MNLKTLTPEVVKDKIVIIRVDFNVPIQDGKIVEYTRIKTAIPTIKFCLDNNAKQIHILSHLGRPKGKYEEKYSLKIIIPILEKYLGKKVAFRSDFTKGNERVQLHENVRFYAGEKTNDPAFIQHIMKDIKPDVFINDGFAVSHRAHASIIGLGSFLPSYPGFLVQKEIEALSPYIQNEKMEGLVILIGGAKMETKVPVLKHFAITAENIIVGGALANTFLVAQGFDVAKSLYEDEAIDTAREILNEAQTHKTGFHCPVDVICGETSESTETIDIPIEDVIGDMKIFDIGQKTIQSYQEILKHAKTIIWNGPVGLFEKDPFANGTREILKTIAAQKSAKTILGGGDTLEAIHKFSVESSAFSHVSTGGGAMLKFLEGAELPGIEILK